MIVNDPSIFEPVFASDPTGAIQAARERIAAGDLAGPSRAWKSTSSRIPPSRNRHASSATSTIARGASIKPKRSIEHSQHNPSDRENAQSLGRRLCDARPRRRSDRPVQQGAAGNRLGFRPRRDARAQGRPSGVPPERWNSSRNPNRPTRISKPKSGQVMAALHRNRPMRSDISCARSTATRIRSPRSTGRA